ncbi:MAG: manganese efflux pump MntP family protein [Candidatus Bipolaricaulota bacterium]
MNLATVSLIAIALAMDAFAASMAGSLMAVKVKWRHALRTAGLFGLFQAGMPVLGWYFVLHFKVLIQSYDHWVAFGLLSLVGSKAIWDGVRGEGENCNTEQENKFFSLPNTLFLALATSIDALAAGISFSALGASLFLPVLLIGSITFCLSLVGLGLGSMLGRCFQAGVEVAGGLLLIGLGLKILGDHLGLIIAL